MQKPHRAFLLCRHVRFSSTEASNRPVPRLSKAWGDTSIPSRVDEGNIRKRENTRSNANRLRKNDELSHIIYPAAQNLSTKTTPAPSVSQRVQRQAAPQPPSQPPVHAAPVVIPIPDTLPINTQGLYSSAAMPKVQRVRRSERAQRADSTVPQNREQRENVPRQSVQAERQQRPSRRTNAPDATFRNNRRETDMKATPRRSNRSDVNVTASPRRSSRREARTTQYTDKYEDDGDNREIAKLFGEVDLTAYQEEVEPSDIEELNKLEAGEAEKEEVEDHDNEHDEVEELLDFPEAEFEDEVGRRFETAAAVSADLQLSPSLTADLPSLNLLDQAMVSSSADADWALKRFGGDYSQYSYYSIQVSTTAANPVLYAQQTVSHRNDIGVNARQEMSKRILSSVSKA